LVCFHIYPDVSNMDGTKEKFEFWVNFSMSET
jgi:hypothetical protein